MIVICFGCKEKKENDRVIIVPAGGSVDTTIITLPDKHKGAVFDDGVNVWVRPDSSAGRWIPMENKIIAGGYVWVLDDKENKIFKINFKTNEVTEINLAPKPTYYLYLDTFSRNHHLSSDPIINRCRGFVTPSTKSLGEGASKTFQKPK